MRHKRIVRLLGLACVVGSIGFSASNLFEVLHPSMGSRGTAFNPVQYRAYLVTLGLVVMPGFFSGQLGYHWLGAGGYGRFSQLILVLAGIGCATMTAGAIYSVVTLRDPGVQVIGIALNQLLAPLLWFIAAMRAKTITRWKRVWPLWMALIPWLMFWAAVPLGFPRYGAPAVVGLFWLVFGVAVMTEAR